MASKNEEYIAVAAVLISLVILSIFFGVFWSFLLVFTFLLLAYLSRRPQTKKKISTKKYKIKQESLDNSLDDGEYISNGGKEMDVPFTGLPSPKFQTQSLRSPMPLLSSLSTVTKRLSFNVSSLSSPDGQIYMLGNASRRFNTTIGSPRQSPMSPITSPQTPKYFSLINPTLQQQSTVKIATPEINNRTVTIDEPKKSTDSPLSRATILSALKQSTIRKRSVIEDEDGADDDVSNPVENHKKKRRYHYPSGNENERKKPSTTKDTSDLEITRDIIPEPPAVTRKSTGIYSLIQARLKRRPLRNDGNNATEEGEVMLKKTRQDDDKTTGLSEVTETTDSESQDTRDVQMTASVVNTERIASKISYDDDNDSGCDADDDDDIVMKTVPATTGAQRLSKKQAQKLTEKRKRIEMKASSTPSHTPENSVARRTPSCTPDVTVSRKQRLSKKQRMLNTPSASEITTTTSTTDSPLSEKSDVSGLEMSPRKRFTVIRFPSKKDESKRRPVPVYCASVNSPDLPKRRSVTHKITKEDIELDRKMAWQRVQSLLDGSDDEEEEQEKNPKGSSPSVAIHVTTCMPSPSRSQTTTVTTASGIPPTSSLDSNKSKETQDTTVSTTQTTSAPSSGTTHPSTLLAALAANKPSGATPLISVPTQSVMPLTGTADSKSSIFLSGALTTPGTGLLSDQVSGNSTTQLSTNQGFSLTTTTSNATGESSATASAPVKNLFRASTSDSANTASLTSFTTSSQSIQTPICTPVAQTLLGTNPTNTTPGLPTTTAPASSLNFGSMVSNQPQVGSSTSSNLPQMGFNLPQTGSSASLTGFIAQSIVPQMGAQTNLPQTGSSASSGLTSFSAPTNAPQTQAKSNLLQTGFNTSSNTSSSLPKFNINATAPAAPTPGSVTTAATSSLFSGLTSNTTRSALPSVTKGTTQASQSGFAPPGGFSFSASTAPKTNSQASTFSFSANQQTAAPSPFGSQSGTSSSVPTAPKTTSQASMFSFGANQQTAAPSPFGSQTGTSGSVPTAPKTTNQASKMGFGASQQSTAPSTFGSQQPTTKSFGSTTSSNPFGATPSTKTATPAFGFASSSSQNTFGNTATSATATPGGFKFGANTATRSTFGNAAQQPATGAPSGQFSFSAGASSAPNQSQNKAGFSFTAGASSSSSSQPFGAASSQSTFGSAANKNAFGAGGPGTQAPFGSTTNQNVFGSPATNVPSNQTNQNAFGSTNQSTFGSPAPQNVFGNPAGSSSAGGFSFSGGSGGGGGGGTSTPSGGGFKFDAGSSSGFQNTPSAAPTFGSTPSTAPGASAGGFNFGAGSTSGTPAFGAATPNAGGFRFGSVAQTPSSSVAKPRPKATARRRPRK